MLALVDPVAGACAAVQAKEGRPADGHVRSSWLAWRSVAYSARVPCPRAQTYTATHNSQVRSQGPPLLYLRWRRRTSFRVAGSISSEMDARPSSGPADRKVARNWSAPVECSQPMLLRLVRRRVEHPVSETLTRKTGEMRLANRGHPLWPSGAYPPKSYSPTLSTF